MRIALAGYGIEGRTNYQYFRGLYPEAEITVIDKNQTEDLPEDVKYLAEQDYLAGSYDFDLIVRSPGFSPNLLSNHQNKVWSATNEFFEKCPAPIIGVTGTKGKGTTCSLITSILREAGKTVHLVGNIGLPALSILPDIKPGDLVVYELSSFQLWDIKKSPDIAVVLMIEPDHLDVHTDFDDYMEAKSNITRFQTADNQVIYHPDNQFSRRVAQISRGKQQRFAIVDDEMVYVKDNFFYIGEHHICSIENLQLPGKHNLENACAAISALTGLSDWPDSFPNRVVAKGLRDFTGLPHRLKFVAEVDGVQYYDDSIATTPGSAIASLRSFDRPKIIILGGYDKGADYTELIEECRKTNSQVIAIGANGDKLSQLCKTKGVPATRIKGDMSEIVNRASQIASLNSIVILSPASASFDMFKNYDDRGQQFIRAIEELTKKGERQNATRNLR